MRSFCSAKASLIFSTKNISVFGYKAIKHLTSWPLNELVKLTMLWTTGPSLPIFASCRDCHMILLPAKTVHHTWLPLRLSVTFRFLPTLLCIIKGFLPRLYTWFCFLPRLRRPFLSRTILLEGSKRWWKSWWKPYIMDHLDMKWKLAD